MIQLFYMFHDKSNGIIIESFYSVLFLNFFYYLRIDRKRGQSNNDFYKIRWFRFPLLESNQIIIQPCTEREFMFFYLSKILTFVIDPLFLLFLVTAILLFRFRAGKWIRVTIYSLFFLCYLCSTGFISSNTLRFVEKLSPPSLLLKHYDGVIVLAGMVDLKRSRPDRIEFGSAVDRILRGIDLVKKGQADYLIISGGDGGLIQSGKSEAVLLQDFALKQGLQKRQIIIDPKSRNTHENAIETAKIIKKEKLNSLLLITSAFHMFRAHGAFRQSGLTVDLLPVDHHGRIASLDFRNFLPSSDSMSRSRLVIHEIIGILTYGLTGKAKYF